MKIAGAGNQCTITTQLKVTWVLMVKLWHFIDFSHDLYVVDSFLYLLLLLLLFMQDFHHPFYDPPYDYLWSMDNVPKLTEFVHVITDVTDRKMMDDVIEQYMNSVLRRKSEIRSGSKFVQMKT
jgi:hypothetical protein